MITHSVHQDVFKGAATRDHIVRFYAEDQELAQDVARYLHEGAQRNEALFVAATPEHWDAIRLELVAAGTDLEGLLASRRLIVLDAVSNLPRLMGENGPDPAQFRRIIGGSLQSAIRAAPTGRVRVFGELVDLLWQNGDRASAVRLESFWEELLISHPFSLLCGYRTGLLDPAAPADAVEEVYRHHNHHVPQEDRCRLDSAVEGAFAELLGDERAARLRPFMEASIYSGGEIGRAERAIFWTRRNLPTHLEPLLERSREHLTDPQ